MNGMFVNTRSPFLYEYDCGEVKGIAFFLITLNHKTVDINQFRCHINVLNIEFGILVSHGHRVLVAQLAVVAPFCEHIDDVVGEVCLRI